MSKRIQTLVENQEVQSEDSSSGKGPSSEGSCSGSGGFDFKTYFKKSRHSERGKRDSPENRFITACKCGDLKTVQFILLTRASDFDINFTDQKGLSGLSYAIKHEQDDIIGRLLEEKKIVLTDSLHCAVDAENYSAVLSLLKRGADPNQTASSTVYPAGSTPLLLACHKNNADIIQILLESRAKKLKLRNYMGGSLRESRNRLDMVRALTCPSYIAITSEDPVMTAFELSNLCKFLANAEVEFACEYLEFGCKCEKFAADLVNAVDNSDDIMILLSLKKKSKNGLTQVGEPLIRLQYALEHDHKLFVAHSHCQQALADKFFDFNGLFDWRYSKRSHKIILILLMLLVSPLWLLVYLALPPTSFDYYLELPMLKAMVNFASSIIALVFLITMQVNQSLDVESLVDAPQDVLEHKLTHVESSEGRGASLDFLEIFVVAWVVGEIWDECRQVRRLGLQSFVSLPLNCMDVAMNAMFLLAFAARFIDYAQYSSTEYSSSSESESRIEWNPVEAVVVYESCLAIATLLAFIRVIRWFQVDQNLGKLQMMLGASMFEIGKFFCLFLLIYLSFSGALNAVYWKISYVAFIDCRLDESCDATTSGRLKPDNLPFITVSGSMHQLFWTMFGYSSEGHTRRMFEQYSLNELVGAALFILYNFIAIIVLLNVLIGMITKTLDNIESNIDTEWKFVRSQIYARFIESEDCAPPPFNIFPTVRKCIKYGSLLMHRITGHNKYLLFAKPKQEEVQQKRKDWEQRFPALLSQIKERYLRESVKDDESNVITPEDFVTLKMDISGLRYELLNAINTREVSSGGQRSRKDEEARQEEVKLMKKLLEVVEVNSRVTQQCLEGHSASFSQ